MSILTINHISKHFGGINVLQDVSLSFEAGTVTAIVGDNGAGKSTLLKLIAGVHLPDKGEILLNGHEVSKFSAEKRRSIGVEMVYQDLALAPQQDIVTNLFMGRERLLWGTFLDRKRMRKEAHALLSELGIRLPRLSVRAGRLSGGQQQAIAIARAIMFSPAILLLDEPTAALGVREVDRVLKLIRQQKEMGRTIVFVSHRLNDVFAISDRIAVLKQGRVVSDTPAAQLTLSEVVERIVS